MHHKLVKMKATKAFGLLCLIFSSLLVLGALAQEQCGRQRGGIQCPGTFCCSQWGFCGDTPGHCGTGCQSKCRPSGGGTTPTPTPSTPTPTAGGGDVSSLISQSLFNNMLKHRNDAPNCRGGFYTYNAFLTAARSFNGFGTTGVTDTRKREIAAFFGQSSHETTGGWDGAPDGRYAWGYCFLQEQSQAELCNRAQWPCATGKRYYGRGPLQLSWNYNYGQAGKAIGVDLINNPDLVVTDPVISFKTALWFWMTAQSGKPSSHDVITGRWNPSAADRAANRVPGYGVITNIINGGKECGRPNDKSVQDRIGFYMRYCNMLGVSPGDNLDCANQRSFA